MTPEVTLRPVEEHELPLLATLIAELDGNTPSPVADIRATWQAMRRYPDYACYFAVRGDEVVGCLSMFVFPVLSHGLAHEAIVEAVVVRPGHRGRGLGRAMMQAAMAMAAEKGAYKLALSSNLRRLDAHRFYEGMGFTRHGYSFSIDTAGAR